MLQQNKKANTWKSKEKSPSYASKDKGRKAIQILTSECSTASFTCVSFWLYGLEEHLLHMLQETPQSTGEREDNGRRSVPLLQHILNHE